MQLWILLILVFSLPITAGSYDPRKASAAPSRKRMGDYAASTAGPDSKQFVRATCLVKQVEGANLATPCPQLTFKVVDGAGKELRKVLSQRGEIKMRVETDQPVFLVLDSPKFLLENEKAGPFLAGESAVLELRPR